MEGVWKCKVVEKMVDVYVIRGVRWYDMIGMVSRCGRGGWY